MISQRIKQNLRFKVFLKVDILLSNIKRRLLGKYGFGVLCMTSTGIYAVDPGDIAGVGGQLLNQGEYGQDELKIIGKFLTPDSRVLIVGSHVGCLAIPISKNVKEVFAIEANPNTFRLLLANIALNSAGNITAIQMAASDKREQISFLYNRSHSSGSKRKPLIKDMRYYYDNPEAFSVEAHSLDESLPGEFNVVIMDIEGSEAFALKGMQRIVSNADMLQVEFLPHHLKNIGGVTVDEFLALISPHFNKLMIPSQNITVEKPDFLKTLREMYDKDQGDNGIIFTKS